MKYTVTKRYVHSNEQALASFCERDDASLFIAEKIAIDERNKKPVLYRLYDDADLIEVAHNEISDATDIEDPEGFSQVRYCFSVGIQRDRAIACFNNQEDAQFFIRLKCLRAERPDSQRSYLLFKKDLLIATLNQNVVANKIMREEIEARGKGQHFNPSPLKRNNKPKGGPPDCWDEEDENAT